MLDDRIAPVGDAAPSGLIFKSIGRKLSAVQRSTVGIPSVTQGGEKFQRADRMMFLKLEEWLAVRAKSGPVQYLI